MLRDAEKFKKIIFGAILGISAAVLIFFRVRYFSNENNKIQDDDLKKIINELGLKKNLENQYQSVLEDIQSAKDVFLRSATTDANEIKKITELEISLKEKFEKKEFEKLDSEIRGVNSISGKEWELTSETSGENFPKNLAARITLKGKKSCRSCAGKPECPEPLTIFSKKILEFYPQNVSGEIIEWYLKENAELPAGVCKRGEFAETKKFFVVDGCVNDLQCVDAKLLDEALTNYFHELKSK